MCQNSRVLYGPAISSVYKRRSNIDLVQVEHSAYIYCVVHPRLTLGGHTHEVYARLT